MKRAIVIVVLCLSFGFAPVLTAENIDVGGDWQMTIQSQKGARAIDVTFVQTGEKLAVTMKTRRGQVKAAGTVINNQVKWIMTRNTRRGKLLMTYTGTIANSSTINGTLTIRNRPTRTWTAKKK
jgi:hypothetical protein